MPKKMIPAAEDLLKGQPKPVVALMRDVYAALVEGSACQPDVKTIYISFTKGSELVASAHPGQNGVELALALPEDHPSRLLEDASHLTWRTLPLLVRIGEPASREEILDLMYEAVNRVDAGEHDVNRPPKYFQAARRSQERNRFWKARR